MASFSRSFLKSLGTGYDLATAPDGEGNEEGKSKKSKNKKRKTPLRTAATSAVDAFARAFATSPSVPTSGTGAKPNKSAYQKYIEKKYGPGAASHPGGEAFAALYGGGSDSGQQGGWGSASAAAAANQRAWETKKQNEAAQPGQRGIGSDAPYSGSSPGTPEEAQAGSSAQEARLPRARPDTSPTGQGPFAGRPDPGVGQGPYAGQPQPGVGQGPYAGQPQPGQGQGPYAGQPQQGLGQGPYAGQPQPGQGQGPYAGRPPPSMPYADPRLPYVPSPGFTQPPLQGQGPYAGRAVPLQQFSGPLPYVPSGGFTPNASGQAIPTPSIPFRNAQTDPNYIRPTPVQPVAVAGQPQRYLAGNNPSIGANMSPGPGDIVRAVPTMPVSLTGSMFNPYLNSDPNNPGAGTARMPRSRPAGPAGSEIAGSTIGTHDDPSWGLGVGMGGSATTGGGAGYGPYAGERGSQSLAARSFEGSGYGDFNNISGRIMGDLQRDYNLTREQAAGIVGNLGHESGGFGIYHEGGQAPLQGGVGWAQWTNSGGAPRRANFESWADKKNLDVNSYAANYGYLRHELDGSHKNALAKLRQTQTVEDATKQFERYYEGAKVKAYDRRISLANSAYNNTAPSISLPARYDARVAELQRNLNAAGAALTVDGKLGPRTRQAALEFGTTPGTSQTVLGDIFGAVNQFGTAARAAISAVPMGSLFSGNNFSGNNAGGSRGGVGQSYSGSPGSGLGYSGGRGYGGGSINRGTGGAINPNR